MRFTPLEKLTPRPLKAAEFLKREEKLDEEIEFDPRRDITEKEREAIVKRLFQVRLEGKFWGEFSMMARSYLLLFPERSVDLQLDDEAWKWIQKGFEKVRSLCVDDPFYWSSFGLRGSELITVFPERREELNFSDEVWSAIKGIFDRYRQNENWGGVAGTAIVIALLFPGRRKELHFGNDAWEGMKRELEKHRQNNGEAFSRIAAEMLLLFPERKEELNLDDETWMKMRQDQAEFRKSKSWGRFVETAMYLSILAAEDARITHDGQILITPKKPRLAGEPTPLPQRKR